MLSMEDMQRYFEIDSSSPSGLRWKKNPPYLRRKVAGMPAGSLNNSGYYLVKFSGTLYGVHRLVYCINKNLSLEDVKFIDHKDGDKKNNSPENLREADRSQNQCNRTKGSNNTTGFKNVTYDGRGKYRVLIRKGSVKYQQDSINTVEEAAEIARRVRDLLHQEFTKE